MKSKLPLSGGNGGTRKGMGKTWSFPFDFHEHWQEGLPYRCTCSGIEKTIGSNGCLNCI